MEQLNYILEKLKDKYKGIEITYMEELGTYNLTIKVEVSENDYVTGNIGISKDAEYADDVVASVSCFINELLGIPNTVEEDVIEENIIEEVIDEN